MQKVSRQLTVPWKSGIHIRPAAKIVKLLQSYSSNVEFSLNGHNCNAKSPIQLLSLAAEYGEKLTVVGQGDDAEAALEALDQFFQSSSFSHEDPLESTY